MASLSSREFLRRALLEKQTMPFPNHRVFCNNNEIDVANDNSFQGFPHNTPKRISSMISLPLVICGFCGGLATILGKVAFSSSSVILDQLQTWCITHPDSYTHDFCSNAAISFRILLFGLMIGLNGGVINFFLKAMEQNHTVVVIVITSAVNFLTTGILGYFVLGEELGNTWYAGSTLIMAGMFFVAYSQGINRKQ